MNKIFTPKSCQGDKAEFKGDVVLRLPAYDERLEMMLESDLMAAVESAKDGGDTSKNKSYLLALSKLVKISYPFYQKVNITRKSDKKAYKSIEDLKYDPSCVGILQEIAMELAAGNTLGKN